MATENEPDKQCDLCHISYMNDEELREHYYSLMHHIKLEQRKKNSAHNCTLCFASCPNIAEYSKHLNEEKHRTAVEAERNAQNKHKELDFTKPNNIETASLRGSTASLRSRSTDDVSQGVKENQGRDRSLSQERKNQNVQRGRGTFESSGWHFNPVFNTMGPPNRSFSNLNSTVDNLSEINGSDLDSSGWNDSGGRWQGERGWGPRNFHPRFPPPRPTWMNNSPDFSSDDISDCYQNFGGHHQNSRWNAYQNNFQSPRFSGPMNVNRFPGNRNVNRFNWHKDAKKNSTPNTSPRSVTPSKGSSKCNGSSKKKGPRDTGKKSAKSKKNSTPSPNVGKGKKGLRDNSLDRVSSSSDAKGQGSRSQSRDSADKPQEKEAKTRKVGANLSGGRYASSEKSAVIEQAEKLLPSKGKGKTKGRSKTGDKGKELLANAEALCENVRKKREQAKAEQEKLRRKIEDTLLNEKIQNYTDICASQMKGYVSSDMLSDLDKTISDVLSQGKESVDSNGNSMPKEVPSDKPVKGSDQEQTLKENDELSKKSTETINSEATSYSAKKDPKPQAGKHVDTAKVKFVKQNAVALSKSNLMKMINAPRSHKERMQLATMMKHHNKPKPARPKLNLQPMETPLTLELEQGLVPVIDDSAELRELPTELLPEELRMKVAKLLEFGPDSETEKCFSDIEGEEYPFVDLNLDADSHDGQQAAEISPRSGKRRRSALSSASNKLDSSAQIDTCSKKMKRESNHDHSTVELALPPNNQRIRDLDPGSSVDLSTQSFRVALSTTSAHGSQSSLAYSDWTKKNDLSHPKNTGEGTREKSPGYSGSVGQAKTGVSRFVNRTSNLETIPLHPSPSPVSIGVHSSRSPPHSTTPSISKSPLSYSSGDYCSKERSKSPVQLSSFKKEPGLIDPDMPSTSVTANLPASQSNLPKPTLNFNNASIFSSNYGNSFNTRPVAMSDLKTSSYLDNIPIKLPSTRAETTIPLKSSLIDNKSTPSTKEYTKTTDLQSSQSSSMLTQSSMLNLSSSFSTPSIQKPKSPQSIGIPKLPQHLSPTSALSSASRAIETANTALASINTNLGSFAIPSHDVSSFSLDAGSSAEKAADPMSRVLEITVKEEQIMNKLTTVDKHVEKLGTLLQNLQSEFEKFKTLQQELATEGQNLRKERLSILKGAVAEKQVADIVQEVTTGARKLTDTSPPICSDLDVTPDKSFTVTEPSVLEISHNSSIPTSLPPPAAESSPVRIKREVVTPPTEPQPPVATKPIKILHIESLQPAHHGALPTSHVAEQTKAAVSHEQPACDVILVKEEPMDVSLCQESQLECNEMLSETPGQGDTTIPSDSCPVEMEYVGSLKTANEAQDLLKEIATNLKDTSYIIVEGGNYLKKTTDDALKSSKYSVQIAGHSDQDLSFSEVKVLDVNQPKDSSLLRDIMKSPDAHSADNSCEKLLQKDIFSEKERFKALLLETVDTSMNLGHTAEEADSSSPTKVAVIKNKIALKQCSVMLERIDKDLQGMMVDYASTSGISSAKVMSPPKTSKCDDSSIMLCDSGPVIRRKRKTKKERKRSSTIGRANIADSSSETINTEPENMSSGIKTGTSSSTRKSYDTDRDDLRQSGVCFTASDVEALGSSNVSFDTHLDLGDDSSTLKGSQTTEVHHPDGSELTVTSSSDVDCDGKKSRLKITSATANLIRHKLLQSSMVELKKPESPQLPQPGLFSGHSLPVYYMQIFEKFLFSCSQDQTVRKFDLQTHQCLQEFHGHSKSIHTLCVTRCGSKFRERLFTGGADALVLEHDALTGEFLSKSIMADKVHCMHEQWNTLYIGLGNGQVMTYDLMKSKVTDSFDCGDRPISCLATAQEGPRKILLVGSFDSSITVRDAKNGLLLRSMNSHLKTPLSIIEKDNWVYSGSSDRTIKVHQLDTGSLLHHIPLNGPVTSVAVHSRFLLASSYDGIVRCFDRTNSFKLKQMYYGAGKTLIMHMTVHEDMIYTANRSGVIEAIMFDTSLQYPCRFRDCGITFGLAADLKYHIFSDHLPNLIRSNKYHCNWQGCYKKLEVTTNKQNLEDHISGHITEIEGSINSGST